MAGVGEKGGAGAHTGERAAFAFEAQVLLDVTLLGHQTDQRFGLMGVELIGKKDPGGLLIGLDGLGDMSGEVGFGACGANAGDYSRTGANRALAEKSIRSRLFLHRNALFTKQAVCPRSGMVS